MGKSMVRILCLLSVVATLAGCHAPTDDAGDTEDPEQWAIPGTFTEEATQQDIEDLETRLQPYDGSMVVMESFPMQYRIEGPVKDDCPDVRAMLLGLEYVAEVGNCLAVTEAASPDESTGSP